jgi:hypothetical protein
MRCTACWTWRRRASGGSVGPPLLRAPDPEPERRPVTALRVSAMMTEHGDLALVRYPAAARPTPDDLHLAVEEAEADLRLAELAAVLVRARRTAASAAWAWAESALSCYPGPRLAAAAAPDGYVILLRDGRRAVISAPLDALAVGSAGYGLLLAGRLTEGRVTVWLGGQSHRVTVTCP